MPSGLVRNKATACSLLSGVNMAKRIDYTKSAKEILWDCLRVSARYIIGKKRLRLTEQERDDLVMDICIVAHDRVMNHLHEWDKNFEFAKFVYWHVWSASGGIIDKYIKNKIWEYGNLVSLNVQTADGADTELTECVPTNSKLLYKNRHEQEQLNKDKKKPPIAGRRIKYAKNKEENESYADYVDYCYEFGIKPMSKQDYLAQSS